MIGTCAVCGRQIEIRARGVCNSCYCRYLRRGRMDLLPPTLAKNGLCKRGHNLDEVGRCQSGGCRECRRMRDRDRKAAAYVPTPRAKAQPLPPAERPPVPEPYYQDPWVTLYHGDCLEIDAWLAADVLVTDPPYGIAWTQSLGSYRAGSRKFIRNAVANDHSLTARDLALAAWGAKPALVFGSWRMPRPTATVHRLIWHKAGQPPGPTNSPFMSQDEEIYVLGDGFRSSSPPLRSVITTHEVRPVEVARIGHPTPKPVELMSVLIDRCPHGVIADPFAGSGSTLVAAKALGRKAIGVELEERYAEIAARRLSQDVLDFEERVVKS